MDTANWILLGPLAMVVLALWVMMRDSGEPDPCTEAEEELRRYPAGPEYDSDDGDGDNDNGNGDDEPTRDGEPRTVAEAPIVYEMRLPTYSSALGLPSPAEVAAALVDEWCGKEGKERQS